MPEKFLATFYAEGEFYTQLMTMGEIAHMVGFSDCEPFEDLQIYRVMPSGVFPVECRKEHRYLSVSLHDRFGNYINSATYPDH